MVCMSFIKLGQKRDSQIILFSVKIKGAKNVKKYKGEEVTILNPSHVS